MKVWLSWELWAALLDPGQYTPDGLLRALLDEGVDVRALALTLRATPGRLVVSPRSVRLC